MGYITFLLFLIIVILNCGIWYFYHKNNKSKNKNIEPMTKKDIILLVISISVIFVIEIYGFVKYRTLMLCFDKKGWLLIVAAIVLIVGEVLHLVTFKELGSQWSDSDKPNKNAHLITNGLYKYIRHPMYSAFLIYGLATFISCFCIPVCFVVTIICYGLPWTRIKKEEENLEKLFGQEYLDYKEKVKYKLIPHIY